MKKSTCIPILLSVLATLALSCYHLEVPQPGEPKEQKDIYVQMMRVDKDTVNIWNEFSDSLTAFIYPESATATEIEWTSLDEKIATVDATGHIFALSVGTTKVVARSPKLDLKDTCVVNVLENIHVESVSLDQTEATLYLGSTLQLTATVNPDKARIKDVTWSSSDPAIATVNEKGVVTPHTEGVTVITVTSVEGGKTATCTVTVSRVLVTGITLNKTSITVSPGKATYLTATLAPANCTIKTIEWSSSDPSVATVVDGRVEGIALGTAVITAKAVDGGLTAQCTVTVKEASTTRKITLTFDFTTCPASMASVKSSIPNGSYAVLADDGNYYDFTLFNGNGRAPQFSANGYLVLNTADYLGTPVIPDGTLTSITFTMGAGNYSGRRASVTSETHTGAPIADYYDASEEAYHKSISTEVKNVDHTFTIIDPVSGKSYYLICAAVGIGVSKVVLTYEVPVKPVELTFDFTTCPASMSSVKSSIPNGTYAVLADDGNYYDFTIFNGNGRVPKYSANGYLVLDPADYLGTPVIPGMALASMTFTMGAGNYSGRRASVTSETHNGALIADYYDASVEAYHISIPTEVKNAAHTFTIIDPVSGKSYYLVCAALGIGVSKMVLKYNPQ